MNFENPASLRAKIKVEGDTATLVSGELKSINMDHPEGIEITHKDGTVEILKGVKKFNAKELNVDSFTM